MSGDTNLTQPAQPTYGEGMREALEAQVALLSGKKVGEADFRGVGKLEDLVRQYEAPLRKTTAQIDTDVMRQTLLGDMKSYDAEGRKIIGYEKGEKGEVDPAELSAWEAETARLEEAAKQWPDPFGEGEGDLLPPDPDAVAALDEHLKTRPQPRGVVDPAELSAWEAELERLEEAAPSGFSLIEGSDEDRRRFDAGQAAIEEHKATRPQPAGVGSTPIYSEPDESKIGKKYYSGGMTELVGDTRAIKSATKQDDYESYVRDNEDNMAAFQAENARLTGLGEAPMSVEQWGKAHYEASGKAAGDEMPTKYGYAEEDPGRRAGFDPTGEFLGLSAFGEDIQAQNLSRQRQRDLEDVARLSPLYSDIMEKYKPGTQEALEDARGVLKAREGALTGTGGSLSDAPKSAKVTYEY